MVILNTLLKKHMMNYSTEAAPRKKSAWTLIASGVTAPSFYTTGIDNWNRPDS